ncbi:MAG: HNH endonuclease [Rhodococcus sp.]|uniref:HNH endonuclease n=1 Tax=Rhodococcus TaxID=1827 RepID=UPI0016B77604|nr:HNH endonuclease [Rhodococcus sp. (in: high G+C Gram-positive bacteria)]NLV79300.1 HNH endonuclease [Rhodococcus sp. (in: high G+C Gram-positive bacteria)]
MKHRSSAHRQLPPADAPGGAPGATITSVPEPGTTKLRVVPDRAGAPGPPVTPDWSKLRVLLLNATYEPLTALPARRAVVLMAGGKADTVHDDPAAPVVHSAGWCLQLPSVIRLRTYVRVPYRARVPLTRAALMHRDGNRCAYCGSKAETIDHVVPRSRGGEHSWENCVACCATCNHRKADKLLSELGWTLRASLTPPKGRHWRLLATLDDLHPTWLAYLGEGAA